MPVIAFDVQSLSRVQLFVTLRMVICQASLSFIISWSLPKLISIELMMPFSHLILCHPLLLLPSIFPSIRVFSNQSALRIRWPKYWSFDISPSNEYSGLISFRIDWFDLLAVQVTLKGLLQHHCLLTYLSALLLKAPGRQGWYQVFFESRRLESEMGTLGLTFTRMPSSRCI